MKPVAIIGIGMTPEDLTAGHLKIIAEADILVGGKRLLDHFSDVRARKKTIDKDIDAIIGFIKDEMKSARIVVLASGDPMFFGIGARMAEALGAESVSIYPNISTVSAAFARLKEPWHGVAAISMHGRNNERMLFKALEKENKIAVFTDPKNNPAWLAQRLIEKEFLNFKMCVLETLGSQTEKVEWYTLGQAAKIKFSNPNMVVLKRSAVETDHDADLCLGAPGSWYDHRQGLITKSEVRAITLSKLRLSTDHILWDLGAGSGSVAVEAALFIKKGRIFAVERDRARIEHITNNKKHFGVTNLEVVQAELPQGVADLPRPDRVFIGGGGKRLENIIDAADRFLKPHGIIVVNTVLIPNIHVALNTLRRLGFETDCIQIQINRCQEMPWADRLEAQNPVWIISGIRNAEVGRIDFGRRNGEA